jgi:hypothetical protein
MDLTVHFFLEGFHDQLFFEKVITPVLKKKYGQKIHCDYQLYASDLFGKDKKRRDDQKKIISTIINNCNYKYNHKYIFVTDKDTYPCLAQRKEKILKSVECPSLSMNNIIIVVVEIESWYVAGLDYDAWNEFAFPNIKSEDVTKEVFEQTARDMSISNMVHFRQEVLKRFDLNVAAKKNTSFKYFYDKFISKGFSIIN